LYYLAAITQLHYCSRPPPIPPPPPPPPLLLQQQQESGSLRKVGSGSAAAAATTRRRIPETTKTTTTKMANTTTSPAAKAAAGAAVIIPHNATYTHTYPNGTKKTIVFPPSLTQLYCSRRYDRSGSAIQDYLLAHAFAFHYHRQFAGACGPNWYPENHRAQVRLLGLLGLEDELRIWDACPGIAGYGNNESSSSSSSTTTSAATAVVLNHLIETEYAPFYYNWQDTEIWTSEWLEYVQKKRKKKLRETKDTDPSHLSISKGILDPDPDHPPIDLLAPSNDNSSTTTTRPAASVAAGGSAEEASAAAVEVPSGKEPKTMMLVVHIRRGDVDPCDNYTFDRYLPNSHYLTLVQQHRTENHTHVVVHSERKSREPWSDFDSIEGIILKLDADPLEAVQDMLDADVLIMSASSFSLVAALFTEASKVVYTPFWHRPQPRWIRADHELTRNSRSQTLQIRHNCSEFISTY
jgi:hypothetical protein